MQYRAEVDGLRALAVLPVILFHAGWSAFSGGYVGVDVFFVISGYLITTMIASELDEGRFSLVTFYERRARRILPALFTVMAVSMPFAWMWLLPEDRKAFAQSVAAVSLFGSNIFFWRESGYFDTAAELKPLLHTWSLAVEEQYYVLFPLFMMAVWRFGRRWLTAILVVAALASLAVAHWGALNEPAAAFFLLPTRAWELLVGSLAAMYLRRRNRVEYGLGVRQAASLAGLLALGWAVFTFDDRTPVPGLPMLLPTLGTAAMILFAQKDTLVGRLLANRPMVGLGLISYSAYLWHQPLFVLARHRSIEEPSAALYALLSAVTLVLAYLTWRFIEQPARDRRRVPRPRVLRYSLASLTMFLAAGVTGSTLVKVELHREATGGQCNFGAADCFAVKDARARVALWGDSFADAFSHSLGKRLNEDGVSLHLFVRHSCPSLLHVLRNEPRRIGSGFAEECRQHNEDAVRVLREQGFDYIVITSDYQWYLEGTNYRGQPILVDDERPGLQPREFLPRRLAETIRAVSSEQTRVIAITPHPVVKDFQKARRSLYFGAAAQAYADYEQATSARTTLLSELKDISFDEVDGRGLLCVGTSCPIVDASKSLLLYDGRHISTALSKRLAEQVARIIVEDDESHE